MSKMPMPFDTPNKDDKMSRTKMLLHDADSRRFATRFLACVLLATCLWQANAHRKSGFGAGDKVGKPVSHESHSNRQLKTIPIRDLRCGMRLLSENPEVDNVHLLDSDVNSTNWRTIQLTIQKPHGGSIDIELLRPQLWLVFHAAEILQRRNDPEYEFSAGDDVDKWIQRVLTGSVVRLDLAELGASGDAQVVQVGECPPLEKEPAQSHRRLITGTFSHTSGNIVDLHVEGETFPLGVTGNHPVWSQDRCKFVRADNLRSGERLRCIDGVSRRVVRVASSDKTTTVYNLEVDATHVYHVGPNGVLVHNTYSRIYRAVSDGELADVFDHGVRPGVGAMETKLFTNSAEAGSFFARDVLHPIDGQPYTLMQFDVPDDLLARMYSGIADGRRIFGLDPSLLDEFNSRTISNVLDHMPIPRITP